MDMEQRHDVEAAVVGPEGERPRDVAGGGGEIAGGEGDEFGYGRGAGGMQEERGVGFAGQSGGKGGTV
jgi:hypothetical protein